MIVQTMTPSEVIRALQVNHSFLRDRMDGLGIKNSKKLKNKYIKDNEIMSRSTYVIPATKDTMVVFAIKHIQVLKGKEYATMIVRSYYKTCYNTYIVPAINSLTDRVLGYMEFTSHSVDRMRERLGKDFDTFFREDYSENNGVVKTIEYHYNGDENERVAQIGDAFAFIDYRKSEHKYTVKTIVSTEQLYSNQLVNKLNSEKGGEDVWKIVDDRLAAITESHLKDAKRKGMIKAVA